MIKFLHLADLHLGCRRYQLEERTLDFVRAWIDVIVRYALPNKLDFVLIAGDFFDRRHVEPQAMNHAMAGLQLLQEHGIPVVVIEGNHDKCDAISPHSWMRSLSEWGLVKLLEPAADEVSPISMTAWNEEERKGSYIDIAGARIFGTHWYGTSANAAMKILGDAVRRARDENLFNILMLHTDVEGQLNRPNIPALSVENLQELRTLVNYVALGHTHKRFEIDNWAFNPGSLEACSIDEYREERGLYLVEVDDQHHITARHFRDYVQRPFQRLSFDVSGAKEAAEVHAGVMEMVRREAQRYEAEASDAPAPIIEISLQGHLGFKNSLLDLNQMRDEARALTGALHVMMRNQSVPIEYAVAAGLEADTSRALRERRIVEDLIMRHNRYRDRASEMAALVLEAKRLALSDEAPDEILKLIEQELETAARTMTSTRRAGVPTTAATLNDEPEALAASAVQALERNAQHAVTTDQ